MANDKFQLSDMLRWLRYHFSSWFADSFIMAAAFGVICASIIVGMFWDGAYAERWAPSPEWKPMFRLFGWSVSWAMITFTAAGIKARMDGVKGAGNWLIAVGVFATFISVTQSVGVVALKAQEMTAQAEAFESRAKITEETNTSRIDELKRQRGEVERLRDSEIIRIEGSIAAIRDDGVKGIGSADLEKIDKLNEDIAAIRANAQAQVKALNDLILSEYSAANVAPEVSNVPEIAPRKFDPLIEVLAWFIGLGNPSDGLKSGITIIYLTFWSLLCPIFGQMLSCYLVITRHNSNAARRSGYASSAFEIDGEELTEDEIREALAAKRARQEAGQKAAETRKRNAQRDKLGGHVEAKEWFAETSRTIWRLSQDEQKTLFEIAEELGATVAEVNGWLPRMFSSDQIAKIRNVGAEDVAAE